MMIVMVMTTVMMMAMVVMIIVMVMICYHIGALAWCQALCKHFVYRLFSSCKLPHEEGSVMTLRYK